tara:strand:- start:2763 stop:3593 length:831 start_codon:yes stop_codon:yes gene_type:complete
VNYPKDYLYFSNLYDYEKLPSLDNKKVLFVFGDSWTNNLYIDESTKHWCYLLKEKLQYDYVINVSNNYDSNYNIFDATRYVLCDDKFPMKQKNSLSKLKEFKVVVDWSTPMRDDTSVAKMYSPYNTATIPDLKSDKPNTKLWLDYVDKWFRVEMYSYDTQKRILFLQEFFNHNNIDWHMFMGFTPLVEKQYENTDYDLRKWIDKERFMFLNTFPNNMQDYLITTIDENFKDEININEMQFENTRKEFFSNEVFTGDGHPAERGLEIMSDIIYRNIK